MKKNYKKTLFKTKVEWLNVKNRTIGGSEASAILNKSKWLTPDDIYTKMVLGKVKYTPENEKMLDGIKAEEHIRALFEIDHKNFKMHNPPKNGYWFFNRIDKPYLSCTPDGLMKNIKTGGLWGIEIKNVDLIKKTDKELWESGTLPDQYFCQMLQYLVVINDMSGVVLNAHLKYYKHNEKTNEWEFDYAIDKSFTLYREEVLKELEYLENKETEFYEKNVLARKRPKTVIKF